MKRLAAALPLLAFVLCFVLIGICFIVLNGPLLEPIFMALGHRNYVELMHKYIASAWTSHLDPTSRASADVVGATLVLVAIGFVVNAFSQMLAFAAGHLANSRAYIRGTTPRHFVGGQSFLDKDYARFSSWVNGKEQHKSQWEWELCNYYLYWGVTFSCLFHLFGVWLASGIFVWPVALLSILLLYYCIMRGRALLNFCTWGYAESNKPKKKRLVRRSPKSQSAPEAGSSLGPNSDA